MYAWALNNVKLARALERAKSEEVSDEKLEERAKEIYVSLGGKLNATTSNQKSNQPIKEIEPDTGGQDSPDDSLDGQDTDTSDR